MRRGVGYAGGGVSWLQQLTLTGVVYDILDVLEALVLVLLRLSNPFVGCGNVLVEHSPLLGLVRRAHLQSLDKGGAGEGQGMGRGGCCVSICCCQTSYSSKEGGATTNSS